MTAEIIREKVFRTTEEEVPHSVTCVVEKMEFSKKMYLFTTGFAIFCVLVTFVLIAFSGFLGISDLSVLGVIVTSCFAEVSVHSGFYIWKAKYENGRKYKDVNAVNYTPDDPEDNLAN